MPPIEKVYEAWSAVADGRVDIINDTMARVASSDGTRTYTIVYNPATDTYASDDNATFWRGYPGYPVLAVMMLRGSLPLDRDFASLWADINWNALNKQYRRDYAAAVAHIEEIRDINPATASEKAQEVMNALTSHPVNVKRLTKKDLQ